MKKITIVEDEELISKALAGVLEDAGFKVSQAYDGEEGLSMIESEKPDLILLDIIMPKMDGLTMLKKLQEKEWGKNIPIIVLTNLSDDRRVAEAMGRGVYSYLQKTDWRLQDVVEEVKKKLG